MVDNHGANIYEISRKKNINPKSIMDFSSNINPLGPSDEAMGYLSKNLNAITTYPDSSYQNLKKAIAGYTGGTVGNIVLGAGTTELLREGIQGIHPKKAMVLAPCYSEYEKELKNIKGEIVHFPLTLEEGFTIDVEKVISTIQREKVDLFIFPNPNNPTGSILKQEEIARILEETSAFLIVDETYVEFTPMEIYSSIPLTGNYENLFVTRGTSKFFGTPGIRLGYGITSSPTLLNSFQQKELLWQINIFADLLGTKMFQDEKYIQKVFEFITSRREEMVDKISHIPGLQPIPSQGNFVLVHLEHEMTAPRLRQLLMKDLIVIRDCSNFKGLGEKYFRFCILDDEANQKLIQKLQDLFIS